jgi:hypothetical protein
MFVHPYRLFLCALLMIGMALEAGAQNNVQSPDDEIDLTPEQIQQMKLLEIEVDKALQVLAPLIFSYQAAEAIGAQYDQTRRSALFVVFANEQAKDFTALSQFVQQLASTDVSAFRSANNVRMRFDSPAFRATKPIRPFGIRMGGSTSTKAGCFEGTVGAAAVDKTDRKMTGYLTCNHVAAAEGSLLCPNAKKGAKQVVPGTKATGCEAGPTVARLERSHPISFIPAVENEADAAFVKAKDVIPSGCGICPNGHFFRRWGIPFLLPVRKCGAGSNYTHNGAVLYHNVWVQVPFVPCGPTATFKHQIAVIGNGFSVEGDSGAMAYNRQGKAVGIIFAGDESEWTFLSPAEEVVSLLHVDLVKCTTP